MTSRPRRILGDVVVLDAAAVESCLTCAEAAGAIADALRAGLDVTADPPRAIADVAGGQLLIMPSHSADAVGLKAITVAPGNDGVQVPRVQGVYLLYETGTLRLRAIIDGVALTNLRTPAVSLAAVGPALDTVRTSVDAVVFGAGPQAVGHAAALAAAVELGSLTYVVRDPDRAKDRLPTGAATVAAGSTQARRLLGAAGVVVCATSASAPLFDASDVGDGAVVIAVGSHSPAGRELPGSLLARATVVVEDPATALREAGDVVLAVDEGHLSATQLVPMADLLTGARPLDPSRSMVFKSTGMAWQDRVLAELLVARA